MIRSVARLSRGLVIRPWVATTSLPAPFPRPLHTTSPALGKKAKKQKELKDRGRGKIGDLSAQSIINGEEARVEMEEEIRQLENEFASQLSLRFDIRTYQNVPVEVDGVAHPLGSLAQLRLKGPTFMEVALSSPEYAKPVKEALEKSGMNIAPYIEQSSVMVPLPRVTRERREELGRKAHELATRAADRIRKVHKRYDKTVRDVRDSGAASGDEAEEVLHALLHVHKALIEQTKTMAHEVQTRLLTESV